MAQRLGDYKTGKSTQNAQAEIEETLRDLISSLRRMIEDAESKGAGESDGQPPLVPMSAELKLIMILQKRVAARTKTYDAEIPQQLRVTEEAADEAMEISRKQGQVEDLTRRVAEKLNKENQTGRDR